MNLNNKEFIIILLIPEILKHIQKNDLLLLIFVVKPDLGGYYFTLKITTFYFDSFGGQSDRFLLIQLPKPINYHKYINKIFIPYYVVATLYTSFI